MCDIIEMTNMYDYIVVRVFFFSFGIDENMRLQCDKMYTLSYCYNYCCNNNDKLACVCVCLLFFFFFPQLDVGLLLWLLRHMIRFQYTINTLHIIWILCAICAFSHFFHFIHNNSFFFLFHCSVYLLIFCVF